MKRFDTIILGAGSAGCVLAARLTEDPDRKVLLLEAGGSHDKVFFRKPGLVAVIYQVPQIKESCDWGYATVPQSGLDGRVMRYTRGRILGGCSTINGMLYIRGNRQNYDDWAVDNPGWSYDEVLPLFKRSERFEDGETEFHGGDGPMNVTRVRHIGPVGRAFLDAASNAAGVPVIDDFNGASQEGASLYQQTVADRKRSSTATAFLDPAMERPNLTVETGAHVTRIVIEKGRAVGVEYEQGGQLHRVAADADVISCLGSVGSPQVLMLSGVGPADQLRSHGIDVAADLPVGENLQDQLYVPVRFFAKNALHRSGATHLLKGILQDLFFNKGYMGDTFIPCGAFLRSTPEVRLPDVQFFCAPWSYPEPNDDVPGIRPDTRRSFTMLPGLIYPESRGTVRLADADPKSAPLIDPAFLVEEADQRTMLRAVRMAREIAETAPLRDELQGEACPGAEQSSDEALMAEIRLRAHTIYHPVGTCKMAPGDDGVVDHTLRVKGIEGLRVADASIMPDIIGGNTNAPSIMIGEKCADLVRA